MRSKATRRFWSSYDSLPETVQELARRKYRLWCENPRHPSLHYKELAGGDGRFSVRIGIHYRALGRRIPWGVEWVWIGSHEDYNRLVR